MNLYAFMWINMNLNVRFFFFWIDINLCEFSTYTTYFLWIRMHLCELIWINMNRDTHLNSCEFIFIWIYVSFCEFTWIYMNLMYGLAVRQCGSVWQCNSAAGCVWQWGSVWQCGSVAVRQCVAVCAAVRGSARSSVRQCVAVRVRGSVWRRTLRVIYTSKVTHNNIFIGMPLHKGPQDCASYSSHTNPTRSIIWVIIKSNCSDLKLQWISIHFCELCNVKYVQECIRI
jgi:hypothetical protein